MISGVDKTAPAGTPSRSYLPHTMMPRGVEHSTDVIKTS
jgi:hypothetical protein